MNTYEPHPVAGPNSELAEGPLWSHEERSLYWVDVFAGMVHRLDEDGATDSNQIGDLVTYVGLCSSGGLVAAVGDRLVRFNGDEISLISTLGDHRPGTRTNDGNVDGRGRIWIGTMDYDGAEKAGALHRYERDGIWAVVESDLTIPNGLDWSPDGETMYHIDTPTQSVTRYRYDLETGEIAGRISPLDLSDVEGVPDGMCVDAEGFLWVAFWGGSAVRRFSPDGECVAVVPVPASLATACAFGGPGLNTLYITTARRGFTAEDREREPLAGRLFALDVDATGRPMHTFQCR